MPAESVKDPDVHEVTTLNRAYYIATRWKKAIDEVAAGDMGRRRMMDASRSYAKAPSWSSFNRRTAYEYLRKLSREAIRVIDPS